jgi:hypothetical protein
MRSKNIASSTSTQSASLHARGAWRNSRYGNGPRRQIVEPRVDASDVGADALALFTARLLEYARGARTHAMRAMRAVDRQRRGAEQLRELAGGDAPHEIHSK